MPYAIVRDTTGREACIKIDGSCGEDLFIETADYLDDQTQVPDNVIDWMQRKYACQMYEAWLDEFASETFDRIKDMGKYG